MAFPGELFVSSTCWNVFDSSTGLALYTEKCIILAWQLQNTLHDRDICTECVCVCMTNRKKIYSWQKATAQQLLQYVRVNNKCIAVVTWVCVWVCVFILCPPTLFLSLRCAYLMQRHTYTHTHTTLQWITQSQSFNCPTVCPLTLSISSFVSLSSSKQF